MTKSELWKFFQSKNSSFNKSDNETVSISIKNIKKLIDIVWKEAESEGYDRGIRVSKELNKINPSKDNYPDFFNGIFKK